MKLIFNRAHDCYFNILPLYDHVWLQRFWRTGNWLCVEKGLSTKIEEIEMDKSGFQGIKILMYNVPKWSDTL